MRAQKNWKWLIVAAAAVVYFGMAAYFYYHFYPLTTLNGRKVGGMSAQAVMDSVTEEIHAYSLTIETRDGGKETINGSDIDLEPQWDDGMTELIRSQNAFAWPLELFGGKTLESETLVEYDAQKLEEIIAGLDCMDEDAQIAPEDATVSSYSTSGGFSIVPCVMGTTIDADAMTEAVEKAVNGLSETLSLEEAGVYTDPGILDDDADLVKAVEKMNKYAQSVITFTVGEKETVLDAETFGDWISVNENLKPVIDKEKLSDYVAGLAKEYNTCYSAKTLATSYGETVTIADSHYGWKVDTDTENEQILKEIKSGEQVERDLNYLMTANSHGENDYGDSYVEINLTAQHLFLYKNGQLVIETDFVSGNHAKGYDTPTGAYGITYTEKDATLRGEDYETPVSYWMPFAGNVGMHDASWRSKFGGTIYKTSGSHGCVNLPLSAAKTIFENVEKNYPVLVYELPGTENTVDEDKEAADSVEKLINAIGKVTKKSASAIEKAREAYDELTDSAKTYVENYDELKKAEKKLKKLLKK